MTHELEQILNAALIARKKGQDCVFVSLVHLKGSSYRKPGVRMLIKSNNEMVGAVSGGCVEKEIMRQAQSVFESKEPKMMVYDGRFRLGCEGLLHLLIEPFELNEVEILKLKECINAREEILIRSFYSLDIENTAGIGSLFKTRKNEQIFFQRQLETDQNSLVFDENLIAKNRLIIAGAEHDAIQLSKQAIFLGWDVAILSSIREHKSNEHFPPEVSFIETEPELFDFSVIDDQTAVVLMTHNYVKDLKFLLQLKKESLKYVGILGPKARLDKLLNELMEHVPDIEPNFFSSIHGPAGLDIGSVSPQEIALSIMSQVLNIFREKNASLLPLATNAQC